MAQSRKGSQKTHHPSASHTHLSWRSWRLGGSTFSSSRPISPSKDKVPSPTPPSTHAASLRDLCTSPSTYFSRAKQQSRKDRRKTHHPSASHTYLPWRSWRLGGPTFSSSPPISPSKDKVPSPHAASLRDLCTSPSTYFSRAKPQGSQRNPSPISFQHLSSLALLATWRSNIFIIPTDFPKQR